MSFIDNQISRQESSLITAELKKVLALNIAGDVVEFGCYAGETSVLIAKVLINTDKRLYVYDSFEGLPKKAFQDSSPIGLHFKQGELAVSKKQFILNVKKANAPMPVIKKAWFKDLTTDDVPGQICFAFLDGDYYQSIKDSFKVIEGSTFKGSVIIVDDYGNESLPGARRAVDEWRKTHKAKLRVESSLTIIHVL